jgi:polyphosphate kinase
MTKLLPMLDPFDQIKQIYYSTTRETIERDLARALELLRQMSDDDARQRAAGLMHGLTDLKREWKPKKKGSSRGVTKRKLPAPKAPTPKGHSSKKP